MTIFLVITIPKPCSGVGVMLSSEHALIIRNILCRFDYTRRKNDLERYS